MKVKAINSFIGRISMNIDEEREIIDKELAKELIKAGHVVEVKTTKLKDDLVVGSTTNDDEAKEEKVTKNKRKKK